MTARIGADDVDFFDSPQPRLLREISGIEPEPAGVHVLLDKHLGVRSTQRLALADVGGGIEVALWPAELKSQAEYLYRAGRGSAMVVAARNCGWQVRPSPHLGFFNSRASQRLYMAPEIDAEVYAERWEGDDGREIGQHSREEVRQNLWPWLKKRDYASAKDDAVLQQFLSILGRRNVHLRPGMRFRRRWDRSEVQELGERDLASAVRRDVNAILAAAGEPGLPAPSSR